MKVILQDYEPRQVGFGEVEVRKPMVRKARLRLSPIVSDIRLFHAL